MNSILEFTVLPTAMADGSDDTRDLLKPPVESILQIFDELKSDVTTCRHYFSCKKQFDIQTLNSTYTQMESKGLFKAMGELDVLLITVLSIRKCNNNSCRFVERVPVRLKTLREDYSQIRDFYSTVTLTDSEGLCQGVLNAV